MIEIIGFCLFWEKFGLPILKITFPIFRKLIKPFNCGPCLSFWLSICIERNVFEAFAVFFIVKIMVNLYDRATI